MSTSKTIGVRFSLEEYEKIEKYYKRKLREFEILATAFKKSDYEIPGFLISNGVNSSQMVRNIEKRMKYQ